MLSDPKARALVENFGDQWLQLRNLLDGQPRHGQFPDVRRAPCAGDARGDRLFFGSVVRDDRSVLDFLDATTPSSTSGWPGTTASPGQGRRSSAGSRSTATSGAGS